MCLRGDHATGDERNQDQPVLDGVQRTSGPGRWRSASVVISTARVMRAEDAGWAPGPTARIGTGVDPGGCEDDAGQLWPSSRPVVTGHAAHGFRGEPCRATPDRHADERPPRQVPTGSSAGISSEPPMSWASSVCPGTRVTTHGRACCCRLDDLERGDAGRAGAVGMPSGQGDLGLRRGTGHLRLGLPAQVATRRSSPHSRTASAIWPSPMNHSPRSSGHRGSRVPPAPCRCPASAPCSRRTARAGLSTCRQRTGVHGRTIPTSAPFGMTVTDARPSRRMVATHVARPSLGVIT